MKKYIFILIIFILYSCEYVITQVPERSYSIEQSKELNVFVAEYTPEIKNIRFNNSVNFVIEEVWSEHPWWYINQQKKIEITDNKYSEVFFRFKKTTGKELYDKGVNISSTDVKYSGFDGVNFGLENININKDTIKLQITLYDRNDNNKWIELDNKSILLYKKGNGTD